MKTEIYHQEKLTMNNGYHKHNSNLVARSYVENYEKLLRYISQRINNIADAENLAQDVWLKLLECEKDLNEETLTSFLYTIARNLVNDFLRHIYVTQDVHAELKNDANVFAQDMESEVSARDLALKERVRVECLPPQRRIIYVMSRYEEKSVEEISAALSLSPRTVENHLRLGRKDVRRYVSAIA
ncbi:MAG: sigma-70 family RNA polymerase sigma factor [Muribaculaceae bacterium]|jgi:RNA polymerase sigma-70 factor (ECF subfamily)